MFRQWRYHSRLQVCLGPSDRQLAVDHFFFLWSWWLLTFLLHCLYFSICSDGVARVFTQDPSLMAPSTSLEVQYVHARHVNDVIVARSTVNCEIFFVSKFSWAHAITNIYKHAKYFLLRIFRTHTNCMHVELHVKFKETNELVVGHECANDRRQTC